MTVISWLFNIVGFLLILAGLVLYIIEKTKKQPVLKAASSISLEDIAKLIEALSKLNTNIQLIILGMACIVLANSNLLALIK